jgi:hypothetical protein
MVSGAPPSYRKAVFDCALTLLTGLVCAGLLTAAALVPAPSGLLPFIIAVSVAVPMVSAWRSSASLGVLGRRLFGAASRSNAEAVRELRRQLDRLPEVRHPLGL